MSAVAQAWKAVVAFLAPGLLLALEPIVTSGELPTSETLTRALVVAVVTSGLVWLKTNGSTPERP